MDYIRGRVTIWEDIDKFLERGIYYYGISSNILTNVLPPNHTSKNITSADIEQGINIVYTTKKPGEIDGNYCWMAYPKKYGDLKHIYCGTALPIDLVETWEKYEIIVNGKEYYLYYQDHKTKEVESLYTFILRVLGGNE